MSVYNAISVDLFVTNTPKETSLRSPLHLPLLHVDRMTLRRRLLVLAPHLDRLVRLARDQTRSRQIERARKNTCLAIQRSYVALPVRSYPAAPPFAP